MNREIPTINKLVQFHNFKRSMQLHESKIKNAKPTLATRTPNPLKVNINLNKTAKQPFGSSFSRMIEIEFENKALLKKLTQKSSKPSTSPNNHHQQSWQEESYMKQITNNRKKYFEEHERRLQNQGLLRRLKSVKPLYEMRRYMSERKTTEKYINSISKFNYKNYKPNKTIIKFDMDIVRGGSELNSSRGKRPGHDNQNQHEEQAKENMQTEKTEFNEKGEHEESRVELANKPMKKLKKGNPSKKRLFTQRNANINTEYHNRKTEDRNEEKPELKQNEMKQTKGSFYKVSQKSFELSQSQTKLMESSFVVNQIPQKQIKINGKLFVLKGKQTMTKLKLQILEVKKDKTIGNEYIHEVEIPSAVYKKRFYGRIDVIIENLKFSEKHQAFYID